MIFFHFHYLSTQRLYVRTNQMNYCIPSTLLTSIPSFLFFYNKCFLFGFLTKLLFIGSIGSHWLENATLTNLDKFVSHVILPILMIVAGINDSTYIYLTAYVLTGFIYYCIQGGTSKNKLLHSCSHVMYAIGGAFLVSEIVLQGMCV